MRLNQKGFVFRDESIDNPEYESYFWYSKYEGKPHLFLWLPNAGMWGQPRQIREGTVSRLPRNLSETEQQRFHDEHLGCGEFYENGEDNEKADV